LRTYDKKNSGMVRAMSERRFRNLIGPLVRDYRRRRGLTQEEFSAKLQLLGATNLDRGKIAKIETQIRSVYDYEWLAFAKVLCVAPSTFTPTEEAFLEGLPRLATEEQERLLNRDEVPLTRHPKKPRRPTGESAAASAPTAPPAPAGNTPAAETSAPTAGVSFNATADTPEPTAPAATNDAGAPPAADPNFADAPTDFA